MKQEKGLLNQCNRMSNAARKSLADSAQEDEPIELKAGQKRKLLDEVGRLRAEFKSMMVGLSDLPMNSKKAVEMRGKINDSLNQLKAIEIEIVKPNPLSMIR